MKRFVKIFLLSLAFSPVLRAQDSVTSLREDVEFLCDSTRLGRGCGGRGAQDAAFYLVRRFKDLGLATRVQSFPLQDGSGHNVIGEMRCNHGSNKWIAVCAYFDGLGEPGGKAYPCADSNASGTAALLELARTMKLSGLNILFVGLDGHNAGLKGSEMLALCRDYKISLFVNLDTIGSTLAPPVHGRKDYLIALGMTQTQRSALEKVNAASPLHLYYDYYGSRPFTEMFYRRISDQKAFLGKGVPSVMFTSGITMNTNKLSDDAASLNYEMLARRVQLIRRWLSTQR